MWGPFPLLKPGNVIAEYQCWFQMTQRTHAEGAARTEVYKRRNSGSKRLLYTVCPEGDSPSLAEILNSSSVMERTGQTLYWWSFNMPKNDWPVLVTKSSDNHQHGQYCSIFLSLQDALKDKMVWMDLLFDPLVTPMNRSNCSLCCREHLHHCCSFMPFMLFFPTFYHVSINGTYWRNMLDDEHSVL